jgi:hypothetical protein
MLLCTVYIMLLFVDVVFGLFDGYGYSTKVSQRVWSMVLISDSGRQLRQHTVVAESMITLLSELFTKYSVVMIESVCLSIDTIRGCQRQIDSSRMRRYFILINLLSLCLLC